jgi:hypothetical protein
MRRLLQATLILVVLCCMASGCGEPGYSYYGNPGYGYAPYSYGFPFYGRGYAPVFRDHHDWEDHHYGGGHHQTFWGWPSGRLWRGRAHGRPRRWSRRRSRRRTSLSARTLRAAFGISQRGIWEINSWRRE